MNWAGSKHFVLVALAVCLATGFVALEVAADGESVSTTEFLLDSIEKTLVIIGAGGVFLLIQGMRRQHREQLELLEKLSVARDDGAAWRRRAQAHVAGLGSEIDKEFSQWGLTGAEREVGLMLLKGLAHKEIASLRGTAETTVRQQARVIYQKSDLPGKTAFSAYFLEDLLPAEHLRRCGDGEAELDVRTPLPAASAPCTISPGDSTRGGAVESADSRPVLRQGGIDGSQSAPNPPRQGAVRRE